MNGNGDLGEQLDISPEQQAYEAKEVQLLLEKDLVKAAWTSTRERIIREWEAADNPLAREMARHKLDAFKLWKAELRALAERHPLHSQKE